MRSLSSDADSSNIEQESWQALSQALDLVFVSSDVFPMMIGGVEKSSLVKDFASMLNCLSTAGSALAESDRFTWSSVDGGRSATTCFLVKTT